MIIHPFRLFEILIHWWNCQCWVNTLAYKIEPNQSTTKPICHKINIDDDVSMTPATNKYAIYTKQCLVSGNVMFSSQNLLQNEYILAKCHWEKGKLCRGFAQLCERAPVMHKIMRVHYSVSPLSLANYASHMLRPKRPSYPYNHVNNCNALECFLNSFQSYFLMQTVCTKVFNFFCIFLSSLHSSMIIMSLSINPWRVSLIPHPR